MQFGDQAQRGDRRSAPIEGGAGSAACGDGVATASGPAAASCDGVQEQQVCRRDASARPAHGGSLLPGRHVGANAKHAPPGNRAAGSGRAGRGTAGREARFAATIIHDRGAGAEAARQWRARPRACSRACRLTWRGRKIRDAARDPVRRMAAAPRGVQRWRDKEVQPGVESAGRSQASARGAAPNRVVLQRREYPRAACPGPRAGNQDSQVLRTATAGESGAAVGRRRAASGGRGRRTARAELCTAT